MNDRTRQSFGISLGKCWQTEHGGLVFQATIISPNSPNKEKGFLVVDPTNDGAPVSFVAEKPNQPMHANGAAAIMRKQCPSTRIESMALGGSDDHVQFLRLKLKTSTTSDDAFLVISGKPEFQIELIVGGTSLVRLRPEKTFTVKKLASNALLDTLDLDQEQYHFWLSSLIANPDMMGVPTDPRGDSLSPERREARDKIARRLKTLRKTLAQDLTKLPSKEAIENVREDARILSNYLWLVQPGSHKLELDAAQTANQARAIDLDPDKTPGANLESLFVLIKKLERAAVMQGSRIQKLNEQIQEFELALVQVKNQTIPMTPAETRQLLIILGLAKPKAASRNIRASKVSKQGLGRRFQLTDQVHLTLGRDAKESDQIVKAAKSSDWWIHLAGGGRGSHVIVSGLSSKSPIPPNILRAAGILALHFSERSKASEGEVYCTRRQFIRKQKGLAPGLWLVDKSETFLIRYDPSELSGIFAKELRDGIQRHKAID